MNNSKLHSFESISQLMRYLNRPGPLHPLITVLKYDGENTRIGDPGDRISLDFYKISFKSRFNGKVKYGQSYYDFENGGMAFLAPRQIVTVTESKENFEGYSLFIHPDFIRKYPLINSIHNYGFFYYAVSEALFLSKKEKNIITSLFNAISNELSRNFDGFSQDILVSQVEQLLNYSNRFYNRQFMTREVVHDELIARLERFLSNYFNDENALGNRLPSVKLVADELHVSSHYLSDMLRSLTGQNTQQHIHNKLIEKAKEKLSTTDLSITEIAYDLGFEHSQSFSKLFKTKTDVSPSQFRQSFNKY